MYPVHFRQTLAAVLKDGPPITPLEIEDASEA